MLNLIRLAFVLYRALAHCTHPVLLHPDLRSARVKRVRADAYGLTITLRLGAPRPRTIKEVDAPAPVEA